MVFDVIFHEAQGAPVKTHVVALHRVLAHQVTAQDRDLHLLPPCRQKIPIDPGQGDAAVRGYPLLFQRPHQGRRQVKTSDGLSGRTGFSDRLELEGYPMGRRLITGLDRLAVPRDVDEDVRFHIAGDEDEHPRPGVFAYPVVKFDAVVTDAQFFLHDVDGLAVLPPETAGDRLQTLVDPMLKRVLKMRRYVLELMV